MRSFPLSPQRRTVSSLTPNRAAASLILNWFIRSPHLRRRTPTIPASADRARCAPDWKNRRMAVDPSSPRFARQRILAGFGAEAQAALAGAHVLVVGAGGLGSAILPLLAAAGVGILTVV